MQEIVRKSLKKLAKFMFFCDIYSKKARIFLFMVIRLVAKNGHCAVDLLNGH